MLAAALASLALARAPLQDASAEPTAAAVIAQLIERTNALRSFRARYHFKKGEDVDVQFELDYQAPDRMLLEIQQGEGEAAQVARTWVLGSRLCVRSTRGGGGAVFGELDFEHPPEPAESILRALQQAFQRQPVGLGAGPQAVLAWGVNSQSDKAEFDLRLLYQSEDRRALLGWLDALQRAPGELALEPEAVVSRGSGGRTEARVSRATGFVEHLRLVGADGATATLELKELELEAELAPELFEVPAPAAGATDMFPDPIKTAFGGVSGLRRLAYAWADDALESGRREWNVGTQEEWRGAIELVQGASLERVHAGMETTVSERSAELATALREALAKAPPGDAKVLDGLREQARLQREGLSAAIDQEHARYLAALEKSPLGEKGSPHVAELARIEREVSGRLFDARVRQPLLELFDGRVREVLKD
jgi:outer membrane lipoprotein-sorting protein